MHKIKYLRVIVTQSCNLNCFFCHSEGNLRSGITKSINNNQFFDCIRILLDNGIKKVKFMGGEPTLCVGLPDIVERIKAIDKTIDVSMITNGVVPDSLLEQYISSGINRINVSLHGYNPDLFKEITGGSIDQLKLTFNTISFLKNKGMLGKVNYVILKGKNIDEFMNVLEYVHENDIVLDVLNYLGENEEDIFKYYYSFQEIEEMISKKYLIQNKYECINHNSINSIRLTIKGGGTINLKVNQLRDFDFLKHCSNCAKKIICKEGIAAIRLTNDGLIKPCLFRDDLCFDLANYLCNHGYETTSKAVNEYLNDL